MFLRTGLRSVRVRLVKRRAVSAFFVSSSAGSGSGSGKGFDGRGVIESLQLACPSPCVMPGARVGDRSPSTAGVRGSYTGEICTSTGMPTPHGRGNMTWENRITYEGTWRAGLHHGEGSKVFTNGGGYSGEWRDGLRHGSGAGPSFAHKTM